APAVEVVGHANSVRAAREAVPLSNAEVLLCDLGLPDGSGVDLIRELHDNDPGLDIMAYTVVDQQATVFSALRAGAGAYVLKGATPTELTAALHELHRGGAPMSPKIARAVVRYLQQGPTAGDVLSPRERQVLMASDEGLTYKEIGERMHLSTHTVHSHIKNIYKRLHATNKREAVASARNRGIL